MEKILISVITVTYNAQNSIQETVQSVVQQNFSEYEYLIIDGASSDNTVDIIKNYANGKIKIISEPDNGIYDAMNKGIKISKGKFLYFLQAGDTLMPGILNQLSSYLKKQECALIYGDVIWGNEGETYDGYFSQYKISIKNICHQAIFYHREIFNIYKKYNVEYNVLADYDLNLKCFSNPYIKKIYLNKIIAKFDAGYSSYTEDQNFNSFVQLKMIFENYEWSVFIYSLLHRIGGRIKRFIKCILGL